MLSEKVKGIFLPSIMWREEKSDGLSFFTSIPLFRLFFNEVYGVKYLLKLIFFRESRGSQERGAEENVDWVKGKYIILRGSICCDPLRLPRSDPPINKDCPLPHKVQEKFLRPISEIFLKFSYLRVMLRK